jgi:hypothetical protein
MKPDEFIDFVKKEHPAYRNTKKNLNIRFQNFLFARGLGFPYDGYFKIQHSPWECPGAGNKDEGVCEIRESRKEKGQWS